jgi:uncharacterized protein (DUF2235 family)
MQEREGKNIVVCCDGTGNEIGENISNVLKLYRVTRKTGKVARQVVFYDPGVGTLARPNPWTRLQQNTVMVLGLAAGYGLDDNVLSAYRFLIQNYEEGDDIFLFGFSRGAYTVRVLAALIHKIGILAPQQNNLADAGLTAYKQASAAAVEQEEREARRDGVEDEAGAKSRDDRHGNLHASLRRAGPRSGSSGSGTPSQALSCRGPTASMPSVWRNWRSADSIQAFGCSARPMRSTSGAGCFGFEPWDDPQTFMHNRFSTTNNADAQDIRQVWFAGVHSDIGGGYPENESGLSKYPLLWMIGEAKKFGLAVDTQTVNQLAWGVQRKNSPFSYVAPSVAPEPHDSMNAGWRVLEWLPKGDKYKEWTRRHSFLGHYIPNSEPRVIPPGAFVHESVIERMKTRSDYRPANLPDDRQIVPMPVRE